MNLVARHRESGSAAWEWDPIETSLHTGCPNGRKLPGLRAGRATSGNSREFGDNWQKRVSTTHPAAMSGQGGWRCTQLKATRTPASTLRSFRDISLPGWGRDPER